ncbi:hypothetical protein GCM10017673_23630 [Streptosporangium violaceochromogenes]|nr:hypothetical protein GCM10017673_23630 [Streptosporangium violaceochromogenes]
MNHQPADDGGSGPAAQPELPRRAEAARCPHLEAGRRCVLPSGHDLKHVYPYRKAVAV